MTVHGNTGMGVDATRPLRLANGTATGNDAGGAGIDIRSANRPRLFAATCGRSSDESGVPWGVSAGDLARNVWVRRDRWTFHRPPTHCGS